jgi:predicted DNA-binding protein with PD1-like motif
MKSQLLDSGDSDRTFILILEPGEEAFEAIKALADTHSITAASVTAIGAFSDAVVGFFDVSSKSYSKIPVAEQSEVLSMLGDIAVDDEDRASPHLHVVLGLSDGSTRGGHFISGRVNPTLEVVITETPARLRRRKRPDLGVALIDLEARAGG